MKKYLLFPLLAVTLSFPVHAALYKWVDADGKVHYGDRVPPKAAQNGHAKLNKDGTTKEKVDSAEAKKIKLIELAKEKARQLKQKEIKKIEALRKKRDDQLLSMFNNASELKQVYENKISTANGVIEILKVRHKGLSEKIEVVEARHERLLNPASKRKLGMSIEDMLDNLNIYQQAITENQIELRDLEKRFEKDLLRYSELTLTQ